MVIQRDIGFPVWGWADQGEKVTVSINGKQASDTAGSDGRWKCILEPMKAGGPYTMTIRGQNAIVLYNILAGDVWVCSGQSNMEWPVKYSANPDREIADGNHPKLRLFEVKKTGTGGPREDCMGQWQECTSHTVGDITAAGYYFGRELVRELDVPVGIIQSAWGGTAIRQWISRDALESDTAVSHVLDGYRPILLEKPYQIEEYYESLAGWFEYCFVQMNRRESYGSIPKPTEGYEKVSGAPTLLFNGMIAPLAWFPIKGFTWYQGESDTGRANLYRDMLQTLIHDWRKQWQNENLPFLIVQLANWNKRDTKPGNSAVGELREAQLMALEIPHTALAVTIDLGDGDVHYKNKQDVGRRLALGALKTAYGRDNVYTGPVYRSMNVRSGKIRLSFDHTGGGLTAQGGESLKGFALAGSDRTFVWADAKIVGNEVEVWSDEVPEPVSVRYGWGWNPECSLYNREGLPASPFRTDDWQGITEGKK